MNASLIYAAFGAGLALPLLPGLLELTTWRDSRALQIDQGYSRDPRYLGKSMREKSRQIMLDTADGARVAFLDRKREHARVVRELRLPHDARLDDVLLSHGAFSAGANATLLDVVAHGPIDVGSGSTVRSIAGDRDVELHPGVVVLRWIDAEGPLTVARGADLGHSASSASTLRLDTGVCFRRLFANQILVAANDALATSANGGDVALLVPQEEKGRKPRPVHNVPANGTVQDNIVVKGDLTIGERAVVNGSIKADGDVLLAAGASVHGNIVARGSVILARQSNVRGHIFAERDLRIGGGVKLASAESPKTFEASMTVTIASGAIIHGWIIAEHGGTTVARLA